MTGNSEKKEMCKKSEKKKKKEISLKKLNN